MKAALLYQLNTPLRIEEVPELEIGPGDLLVRTATCGICRTDLHIQEGLAYVPALPHIGGHVPAGVVVRCGSESGQKALVIGSGSIGVLLVQILKEAGIKVLATDQSETSCEVARKAGADFAMRAGDPNCIAEIQRFSGGGVDCVRSGRAHGRVIIEFKSAHVINPFSA